MPMVCSAKCWFCYLQSIPDEVTKKFCCDGRSEFNKFVGSGVGGSFNKEFEFVTFRLGNKVFGDITAVPVEAMIELSKKIIDLGHDVWFTTSNLQSVRFFEKLLIEKIPIKLKLTVHSLPRYSESRQEKIVNIEYLQQCAKQLLQLSEEILVMQVLFPKYFGWSNIVGTSQYFLDELKVPALCWYRPYYNKWMGEINKELFSIDGVEKHADIMERTYGLNRFSNVVHVEEYGMLGVKSRLVSLPKEHVLYTSERMAKLLKNVYQVSNKIIGVPNRFFGGSIDAAGLLTVCDLQKVEGFWNYKYVALPKEFGYLGNNKKDLLGNEIGREVLFI